MAIRYQYTALDKNTNKKVSGKFEASSELALEKLLSDNNLMLISCREIKTNKVFNFFSSRISTRDLITLFLTLEQLEKAGIPLIESLRDIKEFTSNPKLKDIGQDLYEGVQGGQLLSEAMARHKKLFDDVSISLINIGEKTGNLEIALLSIIDNLKWRAEIKRKTTKAVRGPVFTLIFMLGIAFGLLKIVVPTVLTFLNDQQLDTPAVTRGLMITSDFVEKNFMKILTTPILLYLLIKVIYIGNKSFAVFIDLLKLKLPLIGNLIQKIELSSFAKFFGITFSAGIPILECIDITNKVIKNKAIKKEILTLKDKVANGYTISKSMQESSYFLPIVVRMFKIGEDTGNMEEALKNVNYFYETEINDSIESVIASLKPTILILMGGLLIWIIVGVFGPIYGNFANLM